MCCTAQPTISDNNIGQWLPFPTYPLPNVVLQVQKNIERKVDIIERGEAGEGFLLRVARDFWLGLISDNNIGQWLPFPPYPLPNVVLQVQKNIERKVDIIVATLKEGKRGRAFF